MKIVLIVINFIVLLYSGFMAFVALATLGLGGLSSDPVLIWTAVMTVSSLVGLIGMAYLFKKTSKAFFVFSAIGIAIPAAIFQILSSVFR
ncbi:MAG: hypothetical protein JWO73_159 [Candidatus Taylorbacteria bacterium]|nr:hypothetical protein [Candidatus Taylorbacteria bacterium]